MERPSEFLLVASWLGLIAGIWTLFDRAEKVVSEEVRTAISHWLQSVDPAKTFRSWPSSFVSIFDGVFGSRHFSLWCFWRSSIASLAFVLILTFTWGSVHPAAFLYHFSPEQALLSTGAMFATAVIFNFIPDYLSLLKTRYIVGWMHPTQSLLKTVVILLFDSVASALIALSALFLVFFLFLLPIALLYSFLSGEEIASPLPWRDIGRDMVQYIVQGFYLSAPSQSGVSYGISFYSTFLTSLWVWLYALAGLAVRAGRWLGIGIRLTNRLLDVKGQPLRAIGAVSIVLATVIFWTLEVLTWVLLSE